MAAKLSSFWETAKQVPYEPEQASQSDSFWETAKQVPYESVDQPATAPNQPQDERSYLIDQITGLLKGSAKGVRAVAGGAGSVADLFSTLPVNALIGVYNSINGSETPQFQPIRETLGNTVDTLTGGLSKRNEYDPGYEAAEAIAATVTPAGLAGLPGTAASIISGLGSTSKAVATGAAAGGAAQEYAREGGFGFGGQLAAGFGANTATQLLNPKNIGGAAASLANKALGLDKKNIKLDAIDAAERLGVDLPTAAATDSVSTALINQTVAKTPYYGDKLREKVTQASQQYQNAWEDLFDSISPRRDKALATAISDEYKTAKALIPETDVIKPIKVLEAIKDVKEKLKTFTYSEPTNFLLKKLNEIEKSFTNLPKDFDKLPKSFQEKILQSPDVINDISVKELLNQKIELNRIAKDKNVFAPGSDAGPIKLITEINEAVKDVLYKDYGKTNKKFAEEYQKVDLRFGQSMKRKKLEDVLGGKIEDPVTGETAYTPLLKIINDKKNQDFLRDNLGQAKYQKLEDFVKVASSMDSIKRNTPNPSGTETVGRVMSFIKGFTSSSFTSLGVKIIGVGKFTDMLTDKKFLNKAADFARKPSEPLAKQLENIVKENTGYTIQALNKIYREKD